MKIVVIGGGVIGVTTAYCLNKAGYEVTVIEKNSGVAAECSFANGGQLSYCHAEPWATPSVLKKIPKWLLKQDSPLVFKPKFDLDMWLWAIKFLKRCANDKKIAATIETLTLAMESRQCFADVIQQTGIEFSYQDKGTLHIFRNQKDLAASLKQSEFQAGYGATYKVLGNREECEKLEPALKHSPAHIDSGIYYEIDATGDIYLFTKNLTDYLVNKGVNFVFNESVLTINQDGEKITSIKTDKAEYKSDIFVVATGSRSPILLNRVGIKVPIYPMKGYSISIPIDDFEKAPCVGITDQFNKIVYSKLGNILRVAGTAEFDGYNDNVVANRINTLKKMTKQLFPEVGNLQDATEWACLRPSTPAGTPIIGATKYKNLYLNTGHGTLGWTLSMGSATRLLNCILNSNIN